MAGQSRSRNNRPRQNPGRPGATPTQGAATTAARGGSTASGKSGAAASTGAPRRLGGQAPPARSNVGSAGAQRRASRRQPSRQRWLPIAAIGAVVVIVVALVIVKLTSNSTPSTTSVLVSATGRNPNPAPASYTSPLAEVPASVFNSVGTGGGSAAFTVTKGQTLLSSGGKIRFVYEGGEFCPYCAVMRWAMIVALDRLGTFTNLKLMESAPSDGDIPTFSFDGSTYTSKYVDFTPYEIEDRQEPAQALQSVPADIANLYGKYDGSSSGVAAAPFTTEEGIPFLDIGNRYVSAGDPIALSEIVSNGYLDGGGPGWAGIAQAMKNPNSAVGQTIHASAVIAQANYIDAAICSLNGGKPASVCASPGVVAAEKPLAAAKRVG